MGELMKKDCCFHKNANRKIKIEYPTQPISEFGTPIKSWVSAGSAWAIVEPKSVSELTENGQLINKVTYKIVTRYNSAIQGFWRLDLEGVKLNIVGIKALKDDLKTYGRDFLEIMAVEGEIS
jgi:SPP1 family predicted phage head-tail adaptor